MHILKHGCTVQDVEYLCSQRVHLFRDSYKGRKVIVGMNAEGRILAVILGSVQGTSEGTVYPFSARPADRKERAFYELRSREEDSADR